MNLRPLLLVIAVIFGATLLFLIGALGEIELLADQQCDSASFCPPPATADIGPEDHAVSSLERRVGLR